jgi:predicted transcriptional regulator of viral defense system
MQHWQELLSQGISLLEPGLSAAGPVVTRWRLRLNLDISNWKREVR